MRRISRPEVQYVDVRIYQIDLSLGLFSRKGNLKDVQGCDGILGAIRALVNGAWGFASTG